MAKLRLVLLLQASLSACRLAAAAAETTTTSTSTSGSGGKTLLGEEIPEAFDWERDFHLLEGSKSVLADQRSNDKEEFVDFPSFVDIELVADCDVVPPSLPVWFVMEKVVEWFDEAKPGMITLEPGEVYVVDDPNSVETTTSSSTALEESLAQQLGVNAVVQDGEGQVRYLRGAGTTTDLDLVDLMETQYHRNLPIKVCPRCRNARQWKRCLKVRRKGRLFLCC